MLSPKQLPTAKVRVMVLVQFIDHRPLFNLLPTWGFFDDFWNFVKKNLAPL